MSGSDIILIGIKERRKEAKKMFKRISLVLAAVFILGQVSFIYAQQTGTNSALPSINANRPTAAGGVFVYKKGVLFEMIDFGNGMRTVYAGGLQIASYSYQPQDTMGIRSIALDNIGTADPNDTVTLNGYSIADLMDAKLGSEIIAKIEDLMGLNAPGKHLTFSQLVALQDKVGAGLSNFPPKIMANADPEADVGSTAQKTEFFYEQGQLKEVRTAALGKSGDPLTDSTGKILYNATLYKFGQKVGERSYKPKADTTSNHDEAYEQETSVYQNGVLAFTTVETFTKNATGGFVSSGVYKIIQYDNLGREIAEWADKDNNPLPITATGDLDSTGKRALTFDDVSGALIGGNMMQISRTIYNEEDAGKRSLKVDLREGKTTFFSYDKDGRLSQEHTYFGTTFGDKDDLTDDVKKKPLAVTQYTYNVYGALYYKDDDDRGDNPEQKRTYYVFNKPIAFFSRTKPKVQPGQNTPTPESTQTQQDAISGVRGSALATDAAGNVITYSGRTWFIVPTETGFNLVVDLKQGVINTNDANGDGIIGDSFDFYQAAAVILLMRTGAITRNATDTGWNEANADLLIGNLRKKIMDYNYVRDSAYKGTKRGSTYQWFQIQIPNSFTNAR